MRPFKQVDVFTTVPYRGNPLAVVIDGSGLDDDDMQRFAHWTNLSETTFLLPPTTPEADYRVRIFTPTTELPFAGHPTLGSCHAWLEAGGSPNNAELIVQECAVGLVPIRRSAGRLAFAAPALIRGGPVDEADLNQVCRVLRIDRSAVIGAQWADNGPGWIAVQLGSAEEVLALDPDFAAVESYDIGVVGPSPLGVVGPKKVGAVAVRGDVASDVDVDGDGVVDGVIDRDVAIEVRAFFRSGGQAAEDPVTGSLNAALAQWLLATGELETPYVAAQGTALGRAGRVFVDEAEGEIWVGGDVVTCVDGNVLL